MNYVKHLSIALLLVLGSASLVDAAAPAPVVKKTLKGLKSPGGTPAVKDAAGKWVLPKSNAEVVAVAAKAEVPATGTSPLIPAVAEVKAVPAGIREGFTLDFDATTGEAILKDKAGTVVDLNLATAKWTVDYDAPETALHKFIRTNVFEQDAKYKYGIPAALLAAGVGAYFFNESVKNGVDNTVAKATDFVNDVKDGKGNAQRNAAIGLVAALAAGTGVFYAYEGHLPFRG